MGQDAELPQLIFDTLVAYQKSAALGGAIELDLFSAIAGGKARAADLARHCRASERGVRSLCDYLVVFGFLAKSADEYSLTEVSARHLDRRSPSYIGSISEFLTSPHLRQAFDDVAGAVRAGGTVLEGGGVVAPRHDAWVRFARAMAPVVAPQAEALAGLCADRGIDPGRVLDLAAGHGLYGIALARIGSRGRVTFQDWPGVLAVAEENARAAGLDGRFSTLPGDAFEIDLGGPYDTVLLTNILHHFDVPSCARLLRRARAALAPGGRAVTIEFVVNRDRITPGPAAAFSLVMLASTPGGDAYTQSEFEGMFSDAGFSSTEVQSLGEAFQHALISFR